MYESKEITLNSGRKVLLRLPSRNDAQAFTDFINGLVEEETFEYAGPQTLEDEVEFIKFLLSEVRNNKGVHIIADYDGEKIASADLTNCGYKKEHVVEMELFVRKDFRGDGLGTILLKELETEIRKIDEIKTIILNVFGNNEGAIKLYEKFGYQQCGRFPRVLRYKGNIVDEVGMFKHL